MCSSSAPKPAPKRPEAPTMPTTDSSGGMTDANRRRRAATNSGTILTGSGGVTNAAPTMQKTLLGN